MVSRWYGGIQLHGDRFKHINNVARQSLSEFGFIPATVPDGKKVDDSKSKKGSTKRWCVYVCLLLWIIYDMFEYIVYTILCLCWNLFTYREKQINKICRLCLYFLLILCTHTSIFVVIFAFLADHCIGSIILSYLRAKWKSDANLIPGSTQFSSTFLVVVTQIQ